MINAQRNLGEQGFSTGGRPPFFLRRWLIDPQGNPARELKAGEVVRMPGHHVAWLPTSESDLLLALRIVEMLDEMPGTKVAQTLTQEGIPSPDAGRYRKDHGIRHQVSGVWHSTTITNTAYSCYLIGESVYGRRSMGEEKRVSSSGPRDLTEADYREDGKPKVVRNPESEWTKAPAKFKPLIDVSWMKDLLKKLDKRGGTQRGKPRSRDDANNPLGLRIFDMDCTWPMYREPYKRKGSTTFRYKCGAYTQSHGAVCAHNHVDGMAATHFVLGAIQQRFHSARFRSLVEEKLQSIARNVKSDETALAEVNRLRSELIAVEAAKSIVQRNMARATSDAQYAAISAEFDTLVEREQRLSSELEQLENERLSSVDPQGEVAKAMSLFDRIASLVNCREDLRAARELFELVNANLFLRFRTEKWGKREVQRVASGVLTFGTTPPPVQIYQGKTGRLALKEALDQQSGNRHGGDCLQPSDGKDDSLGNVSRGDWI
jgi:hypothetical protein